jgi:folate-dependent phosphoribosylglycinamide formyltransferase PurN
MNTPATKTGTPDEVSESLERDVNHVRGRPKPTGRIVVITNGNFFSRLILDPLFRMPQYDVAGVVIVTGIAAGKTRWQSLSKILKTGGLRHFAYKASTYVVFALSSQVLRRRSFFAHQLAKRLSIDTCFTPYVNEPWISDRIASWRPDILVSVSCPQRIDARVLSLADKFAINVHSSLLPRYAGIEPYLWVLSRGETRTGTTVHIMREELDTGDILVQKELAIRPGESVFSLFYRLAILGGEAVTEAIDAVMTDTTQPVQQDESNRTYFSWPDIAAVQAMYDNGHRFARLSDFRRVLVETR